MSSVPSYGRKPELLWATVLESEATVFSSGVDLGIYFLTSLAENRVIVAVRKEYN